MCRCDVVLNFHSLLCYCGAVLLCFSATELQSYSSAVLLCCSAIVVCFFMNDISIQ